MARILVVEDDPSILNLLTALLTEEGHHVVPATNGQAGLEMFDAHPFDLLISDLRMSPMDGLELLEHVQKRRPRFPVIMMTAYGTVESAVEAMKVGAFDYIPKPFKINDLLLAVRRALEYHQVLIENMELKARLDEVGQGGDIVAVSPLMRNVFEMVRRVAPNDVTVLIQGESGTGKELVARFIHTHSNRKNRPKYTRSEV